MLTSPFGPSLLRCSRHRPPSRKTTAEDGIAPQNIGLSVVPLILDDRRGLPVMKMSLHHCRRPMKVGHVRGKTALLDKELLLSFLVRSSLLFGFLLGIELSFLSYPCLLTSLQPRRQALFHIKQEFGLPPGSIQSALLTDIPSSIGDILLLFARGRGRGRSGSGSGSGSGCGVAIVGGYWGWWWRRRRRRGVRNIKFDGGAGLRRRLRGRIWVLKLDLDHCISPDMHIVSKNAHLK